MCRLILRPYGEVKVNNAGERFETTKSTMMIFLLGSREYMMKPPVLQMITGHRDLPKWVEGWA